VNPTAFESIAAGIESLVTAAAIIVGGGWALWRFVLQGENVARLEIELGMRVIGEQAGSLLTELEVVVENKGKVRHWIKDFYFNLYCLGPSDALTQGDKRINEQVLFSRQLQRKRFWIPENWIKSFIEPGVRQRYTYITAIPRDASSVLLYSEFRYSDQTRGFHTAQRVFPVKPTGGLDLESSLSSPAEQQPLLKEPLPNELLQSTQDPPRAHEEPAQHGGAA
jgi:hypothetical protein